MNRLPKIILEGTYRASDKDRAYRLVSNVNGTLTVESENGRDAMNQIIWRKEECCSPGTPVYAVLLTLTVIDEDQPRKSLEDR